MRIFSLTSLACCALLVGCGSGFENNYHPTSDLVAQNSYQRCSYTKVEKLSPHENLEEAKARILQQGYVLIGDARWTSIENESDSTAHEQGKKVGACIVLWRQVYAGTEHSTRTVSTYVPKRKIKTNGKTIKIPAYTEYHEEPVTYEKFDYAGLFFVKRPENFDAWGMETSAPSTEYMADNDSRRGVLVTSVKEKGQAYNGNIFAGDIILQINGQDVFYGPPLPLTLNGTSKILLDRKGKKITKTL